MGRYRRGNMDKQEYSQELQQQMASKVMSDKEARTQELRKEMDMMKYDPYGKPGAGAPNRAGRFPPISNSNSNNNSRYNSNNNSRNNSSKSHKNRMLREETFHFHDPWGKGVGQRPEVDKDGRINRGITNNYGKSEVKQRENKENGRPKWQDRRGNTDIARNDSPMSINSGSITDEMLSKDRHINQSEPSKYKSPYQEGQNEDRFGRSGGKAPITSKQGQTPRKRGDDFYTDMNMFGKREETPSGQASQTKPNKRHFDEPDEIYFPFGKVGAGAPLKDNNGRLRTSIGGQLNIKSSADQRRREQALKYREEIQKEIQEQTRKRKERDSMLKHGGGTLKMRGLVPQNHGNNFGSSTNENESLDKPRMRGSDRRSPEIKRGREDKTLYTLDIEKAANDRRKHNSYNPAESFNPRRGNGSASSGGNFNLPDLDQSRGRDSRDPPPAPRGEQFYNQRERESRDPSDNRREQAFNSRGRDPRDSRNPDASRGQSDNSRGMERDPARGEPRREHYQSGNNSPTKVNAGRTPRANHKNNYEVPVTPEIKHGNTYTLRQPWAGSVDI